MKSILLTGAGVIMLICAGIGVVLPLWPTTPFVLVAFGCFAHHPGMQSRILKIPFFKEHLENYQQRRGLTKATVIKSLTFLWGALILSMVLTGKLWTVLLLTAVGTAVTLHILHVAKPRA